MELRFGLLGELRVTCGECQLPLAGARQRALLARLLLSRNELVSCEALVEDLHPAARNGQKALQVGVVRLRRALGAEAGARLLTRDGGYELVVGAEELDLERFTSRLSQGAAALKANDLAAAADAVAAALAQWRGAPLAEFGQEPWARAEIARLDELHLQAFELEIDVQLVRGGEEAAIARLEQLAELHPTRERLRERLMRALYRAGRQADALAAYRDLRRHLVEEHGIEPGEELRALHQAILLQDASLTQPTTQVAGVGALAGTGGPAPRVQLDGESSAGVPFVGRVAERAALAAALTSCLGGRRVAALVSGEPGIGKTRLAGELASLARGQGFEVLLGRCDDDLAVPFKPFVEALGTLLAERPNPRPEAEDHRREPVLARLFPGRAEDSEKVALRREEDDGRHTEGLQYALFAAIATLLLEESRARPLLLILEDLHWADRPTLLLLKHLLTFPGEPRLMVFGTYRAGDLAGDHPLKGLLADLHREGGVLRLELIGLLDAEVGELVGALAGGREALAPGAARALRRSTAGNPFFVTELTRALLDAGRSPQRLFDEDGGDEQPSLPLPLSIRETVSERVARLGGEAASFLAAAAVLGVSFDPDLVAPLAQRPRGAVLEALEAALASELLLDSGEQMAFRHALIAQTIYETISSARRRELHRRAAGLLARQHECDRAVAGPVAIARHHLRAGRSRDRALAGPAAIARHHLRAGKSRDRALALAWVRRAASDALGKLAPQEAQRWCVEALALLDESDAEGGTRCDLLIELGEAQRQSGDPAYRQTLLEAARIAGERGDGDALIRAALANTRGFVSATGGVDEERIAVLEHALQAVGPARSAIRARLLATLAGELSFTGDRQRRASLSDEALEIARALADPHTLVHVISPRTVTIWSPATLSERLQNTAECTRAADELGDPFAQFEAVHWRASTCVESGSFAEAAACRRRARELAERLRQPAALWMARYDESNEALIGGRLADAERIANEAFAIGQGSGQPDALLILASQLMVIRYEQGRLGECVELIARSLSENPRITGFRAVLALGYCELRRDEEAAAILLEDASDRFESLACDLTWLSVVCVYAHVAARVAGADADLGARGAGADADRSAHLDDMRVAVAATLSELQTLLQAWGQQVAYTGAGGWGLVEHYLGMLAHAAGELDGAVALLESALQRAQQLPAPIWALRSRLELARSLVAIGRPRQAETEIRIVCREAASLGCAGIERDGGELLAGSVLTA